MKPVNLLALDGGGIRGVSELLILHEMMKRVQFDMKLAEIPRPCDFFHLIGGTSTGGLIALMLGRLRMTTEETLEKYDSIASAIFSKKNRKPAYKDGAFKATTLKMKVIEIVAEKNLGVRMQDNASSNRTGNAFVCAIPAENMAHPRHFRTYQVRENASFNCMIWEAARATTAAPTFFKRIAIGENGRAQEDFLDGGMRFNNPAYQVIHEARSLFGDSSTLGCLVSIGTGHPGIIGLSNPDGFQTVLPVGLIPVLKRIATDCEETAHTLALLFKDMPNYYFRYNVTHGAGKISLEEWKKIKEVEQHTKAYMEEISVSQSIDAVVKILCRSRETQASNVTLQSLCSVLPRSAPGSGLGPSMKRQPLPSALFTGRVEILEKLESFFVARTPGHHSRREFLLHGMGGAGKTQVSLKFAELHKNRFQNVFWIDASNTDTLEQGYKDVALRINADLDQQCSLQAALQQLESLESEWLLLFDGADDMAASSSFWPPGHQGNVLYTSRNHMLRRLPTDHTFRVDEMNEDEAVTLLLKAARLDTSRNTYQSEAISITKELGFLALAIDQAGAYIANGQCHIQDFLATFRHHRQELLGNEAYRGASSYDRAVYATWDLSYYEISKLADNAISGVPINKGAGAALQILKIFAFFHYDNIMENIFKFTAENPRKVFSYGSDLDPSGELEQGLHLPQDLLSLNPNGTWDSYAFREGISLLLSYSLLSRDRSFQYLSMHRLVHGWVYDRLSLKDKQRFLSIALATLAGSVNSGFENDDYTFRRILLPHITTLRNYVQSSSNKLTTPEISEFSLALYEAGRWAEAEELEVQVMETRKRVLGAEHPDTLTSIANLASTQWNQGRWTEAEKLFVQVMETRKRVLGAEHPDTLISIANLASTYRNQGRWTEAEKLEVQVMETSLRVLGAEHPSTLTSIANLASTYRNQGRWTEAEKLFVQVMETRKRVLGAEHPDTLTSIANLASTYRNQGRWTEAEKLEVQVMETRKRVLGAEHPDTLTSIANLASTQWNQGRWTEAEKLEVQVMGTSLRVLGAEHPSTLTSIANLASTYRNQGRWTEAEKLFVQVMETRKRVLGAEHPDTLTSIANLASTYRNQGRWTEAEKLEVQVMETRKRVLGAEHPDTLTSIANLASTQWNQGRWTEAEKLEVQVMGTSLRVLGAEHPSTLISIANLASTYRNQGRWTEAEKLEVQVMGTSLRVLGAEHPSTLISMANLASTYRNQGRWTEAEKLEVQVMETSLRVLGAEHPSTLTSIANLASTYRNQGRWTEAEKLEVQVMGTRKRVLGAEHPSTLTSIANLASTYRNQGRWTEAEKLFVQVMETRKRVLGAEHPDTLSSMDRLAHTYKVQNRDDEAIKLISVPNRPDRPV